MNKLIIYAADIGSVKKKNFGWARLEYGSHSDDITSDTCIKSFAQHIREDISKRLRVSLGFECPLFLDLPEDPIELTSARTGEGSRSWSAGAGLGALATGLTEVLWVLNEVRQRTETLITPTFSIAELNDGKANLLIWEAFVTSKAKGDSHTADAEIAVLEFANRMKFSRFSTDVYVENPYSLVGAALLKSGITKDIGILSQQCLVIKA